MAVILPQLIAELLTFSLDLFEIGLLVFNLSAVIAIVFVERRNPTAALAWLAVLILIPYLGFILYLLFGRHLYSERRFCLKGMNDQQVLSRVRRQRRALDERRIAFSDAGSERFRPLMRLLLAEDRSMIYTRSRIGYEDRGEVHFAEMLGEIRKAHHHVHMEYYIIRNDELGRRFIEALAERARAGVRVRLVYDAVGCLRVGRAFFRPLVDAGGKVVPFYPGLLGVINFRINYRNHRKILVVDGLVGFLGGFNIGVEYLGDGPLGYWRDAHLRIEGDTVQALQARFLMDWNHASGEQVGVEAGLFPDPREIGSVACQVASSGPDTPAATIKEGFLRMLMSAERSIEITTPYFVPDDPILDVLRIAALSGVQVRILIPSKPDHIFVYWTTLSYVGSLLEAGVRAFTYNRGFLHAKTCVVDGRICTVGTANWDVRSFRLNFETNAFVYDQALSETLQQAFDRDLEFSTELTRERYTSRGRIIRFKESISRLLTSVL
ncbi:Major cardiolipin synthase ClsA [anaerobic digester metagenome]